MVFVPALTFAAVIGSSATNADIHLPANDTWTTLREISVPASNKTQYCTAVGSADIEVHSISKDRYLFTLTLDDPHPPRNLGQERTVEFEFDSRISVKAVTTTHGFTLAPGSVHTIYWLGRPDDDQSAGFVIDRSLTVVCDTKTLGIDDNNPEPLLED
jgi:hypothetical protein